MYRTIIKRIGFVFLLLTNSIAFPAEKTWYHSFAQYTTKYYIAGAVAALIIGKKLYDYYKDCSLTHEQCIEKCQTMYKKIYQDTKNHHHFYQEDARLSDWDLREIILHNNQETYPFMIYYSSITQACLTLQAHLLTLKKQFMEIDKHTQQLRYTITSDITAHQQEMLLQLEMEGKDLQNFIIKTITLMMILKNKVKLFKEYNDDCYCNANLRRSSRSIVRSASTISSRSPSIT